jgi:hypothetical protein
MNSDIPYPTSEEDNQFYSSLPEEDLQSSDSSSRQPLLDDMDIIQP